MIRYQVSRCPNGSGWYVADTAERKIAAGPFRTKEAAERAYGPWR